jgi:hypothetical protein
MIKKIDLFVVINNGGMGIIPAAIFWIIKVPLQNVTLNGNSDAD